MDIIASLAVRHANAQHKAHSGKCIRHIVGPRIESISAWRVGFCGNGNRNNMHRSKHAHMLLATNPSQCDREIEYILWGAQLDSRLSRVPSLTGSVVAQGWLLRLDHGLHDIATEICCNTYVCCLCISMSDDLWQGRLSICLAEWLTCPKEKQRAGRGCAKGSET